MATYLFSERTVLLSGEQEAVARAQELVVRRVQQDPWARGGTYGNEPQQDVVLVRIVVPAAVAGAIIGRQGVNINSLKDATGAHIKVCPLPSPLLSIHIHSPFKY